RSCVVFSNHIHVKPAPSAGAKTTVLPLDRGLLHHFSYVSVSDVVQRMNRYTTIEATQLAEEGIGGGRLARYGLSAAMEGLNRAVRLRGWKAGWRSRSLVLLMLAYRAIVWIKARELEAGVDRKQVAAG